jgi:hypothetical protein
VIVVCILLVDRVSPLKSAKLGWSPSVVHL